MKFTSLLAAVCLGFVCSTVSADYCADDGSGNAAGCSWMLKTGSPMDPKLVFAALKDSRSTHWQLSVLLTLEEWARLEGNSAVRIDGGESHELEFLRLQRDRVTTRWFSESAAFAVSENVIQAISEAKDEVEFSFSTSGSDPVILKVSSGKLTELSALIAEARAKL